MKKIIDGKLYDSEEESNINVAYIESNWTVPVLSGPPSPMWKNVTLYKTENGNFFFEVCEFVGKNLPSKEEIIPMQAQHAMRWCVDNQDHIDDEIDFSLFDDAIPRA